VILVMNAKAVHGNSRQSTKAPDGGGARYGDDVVKAAQSKYTKLAEKTQQHHVTPKYLGGDPKGPTVPIDAAYHQEITNAFREAWPYGQGAPSPEDLQRILNDVYSRFPLPGGQ